MYANKLKFEKIFWVDPIPTFLEQMNELEAKEHENQHRNFINAKAVRKLLEYLTSRIPQNVQWILDLGDD